jgi:predicted small lipoprotein YifL
MRSIAIVVLALAGLAACGEKPQQLEPAKKADAPAWKGTSNTHSVPGWTAGDQNSWETQMKNRAQRGQDEYPRTSGSAG